LTLLRRCDNLSLGKHLLSTPFSSFFLSGRAPTLPLPLFSLSQ
jgi:hypothetical protein